MIYLFKDPCESGHLETKQFFCKEPLKMLKLQCFFRLWTVNVKVPWIFSAICSNALLHTASKVPRCSQAFSVTAFHRSWLFHERLWTFYERFQPIHERFGPCVTFLWPIKLRNGNETFKNGQERWTFRNVGRLGTLDV